MQHEHLQLADASALLAAGFGRIIAGPNAGVVRNPADVLLDRNHAVKRALIQLKRDGIKPLHVSYGARNPIIEVRPGPCCDALPHVAKVSRQVEDRRECVMVAVVEGCQIEWAEVVGRAA